MDVDPNGGLYNLSPRITSVRLTSGQTYNVAEPTREGYTFVKWEEVTNTNSFNNNVVSFNGRNVRLRAKWIVSDDVVARIDRDESLFYVTIQAAIDDARNGETIYLLKDTSETFTNDKNVTFDMQGHKVTGSGVNESGYSMTLINGSIENENGAAFTNEGTLTLGINDDNLCDVGDISVICAYEDGFVSLIGTTNGIVQNGTLNFYGGKVLGSTNSRHGDAAKTETKWELEEHTDDNNHEYSILKYNRL